jgi:flavorubredoxin
VIIYDTMWNSTQRMAKAVEDGLVAEGISVKTLRLRENHRSNIAAELIDASAILVGSPTLNNNLFPTVADILCYLKGLRPKNLIGAAFGSYGWGGEAVTLIKEALVSMRVEMAAEPIKVPFVPDNEALVQCQAMGKQVAAKLKEMVAAAPSE